MYRYCCMGKVEKREQGQNHLTETKINEFEQETPEALENWINDLSGTHLLRYNNKYEIPSENMDFDKSKVMGQGKFGLLVKGLIKSAQNPNHELQEVAIKIIYPGENVDNLNMLLSELKIMSFIGRHGNIVALIGACTKNIRNRELMVAIEFCHEGNLFEYIKKHAPSFRCALQHFLDVSERSQNPSPPNGCTTEAWTTHKHLNNSSKFCTRDLIAWSIQIATGMDFLETKQIVHGGLATKNILLDKNLVAKVGHFGRCRYQPLNDTLSSDVWAFGVVLWEIFSLAETLNANELFIGKRLEKPKHASDQLYEVMLKCWRVNTKVRPSFKTLLNEHHLRSKLLFCQKCLSS